MPVELISAIASVGTFVVIAATAVAAIIQLRHLRGSNQIVTVTETRETFESPEFAAARRFVQDDLPAIMQQPGFSERVARSVPDDELRAAYFVSNFYEHLGSFVKYGIIDKRLACDLWSGVVLRDWDALLPFTTLRRRSDKSRAFSENFEYFVVLCQDWDINHPDGAYPSSVRRMPEWNP
jgi:hypothetical protein